MITPELQTKIQTWRAKAAAGTITEDEMREAVAALRQSRLTAAAQPTKAKTASRGPARSADDMLGELGNL